MLPIVYLLPDALQSLNVGGALTALSCKYLFFGVSAQ